MLFECWVSRNDRILIYWRKYNFWDFGFLLRCSNLNKIKSCVMLTLRPFYRSIHLIKRIFQNVKIGDLVLGSIVSRTQMGMMVKILCTTGVVASVYYVADINIKVWDGLNIYKLFIVVLDNACEIFLAEILLKCDRFF